ncbi:MAG: MFS transporter [Rhizomicrobium sp.]
MSQSEVQDGAPQPVAPSPAAVVQQTVYPIIFAIAFCHMLNDMMQSLLPAIYPNLKKTFDLDFVHIGLVTLTFQLTSSLLQPFVGLMTDKRAVPFALPTAMIATFCGLLLLAFANSYALLLVAAATVGIGSSVFHPESSRVAHMAAGPRRGFAQSMFQSGGNIGQALGALGAAAIVAEEGQRAVAWFCVMAAIAIAVLFWVGRWYKAHGLARAKKAHSVQARDPLPTGVVRRSLAILVMLIFSKFVYLASLSSYLTFYLIEKFHVSVQNAQLHLFLFLAAVAAGTIIGGPLGDRFGRKRLIWFSILGALPFTLALPYANLFWTSVLSAGAGLSLASAFPRHRRLWTGACAREGRHDQRLVLRPVVRDGWIGRGRARLARGPQGHRVRLCRVRVPARDRIAGRVPARSLTTTARVIYCRLRHALLRAHIAAIGREHGLERDIARNALLVHLGIHRIEHLAADRECRVGVRVRGLRRVWRLRDLVAHGFADAARKLKDLDVSGIIEAVDRGVALRGTERGRVQRLLVAAAAGVDAVEVVADVLSGGKGIGVHHLAELGDGDDILAGDHRRCSG